MTLLRVGMATVLLAGLAGVAAACPFCVAEMQTLSEELEGSDAAAIGRLTSPALPPDAKPTEGVPYGTIDPETGKATFSPDQILKGQDLLVGVDQIEAIYFGTTDYERRFLLRGTAGAGDRVGLLDWMIPLELSPLAVDYVKKLQSLPAGGADRLAFFQPYLEHEDRQLAQDAYDEFARAPYDDLKGLADRIDRPRVLELLNHPRVSSSRRRLFFIMLGVCGQPEDVKLIESLLSTDAAVLAPAAEAAAEAAALAGAPLANRLSTDAVRAAERRRKLGLDAMIACYLTLRGESGLDLIDRRFLGNPAADQTHIYNALMALRFLAQESGVQDSQESEALETGAEAAEAQGLVSRERLLASARLLLDNDYFADQAITDLCRWEDWSVLPRLGEMFRVAGGAGSGVSVYVREPIVTFLDIAAEQPGETGRLAAGLIGQLEPIDPKTFARARSFQALGFIAGARAGAARGEEAESGGAGSGDNVASDGQSGGAPARDSGATLDNEVWDAAFEQAPDDGSDDSPDEADAWPPHPADFGDQPDPFAGPAPSAEQPRQREAGDVLVAQGASQPGDQAGDDAGSQASGVATPRAVEGGKESASKEKIAGSRPQPEPSGKAASARSEPSIPAGAAALNPPGPAMLVAAPVIGAVACFGLFWLLLRGGA
ncbi:MAG: hypothetical protein AAGB00_02650 [Planctomycetota bacterium]